MPLTVEYLISDAIGPNFTGETRNAKTDTAWLPAASARLADCERRWLQVTYPHGIHTNTAENVALQADKVKPLVEFRSRELGRGPPGDWLPDGP